MDSERKKNELINTENILVVARERECGVGEMGEGGQKVQTSNYKIE